MKNNWLESIKRKLHVIAGILIFEYYQVNKLYFEMKTIVTLGLSTYTSSGVPPFVQNEDHNPETVVD